MQGRQRALSMLVLSNIGEFSRKLYNVGYVNGDDVCFCEENEEKMYKSQGQIDVHCMYKRSGSKLTICLK